MSDQAFPSTFHNGRGEPEKGMTLRDYFAAKALTGFLETAIDWIPTGKHPDCDSLGLFKDLARDSYVLADAMLKARDGNS